MKTIRVVQTEVYVFEVEDDLFDGCKDDTAREEAAQEWFCQQENPVRDAEEYIVEDRTVTVTDSPVPQESPPVPG